MENTILTRPQAARLRAISRRYKPRMGKSWRHLTPDELWLKVLAQIIVVGNSAPADTLERSEAFKKELAFSRLKRLNPRRRRQVIHSVLWAIGTRYVGENTKNAKIDAALENFKTLDVAGGPKKFFEQLATRPEKERIQFLSNGNTLKYYGKKGARDTLIELGLAKNCLALDARILGLLGKVGAEIKKVSLNRNYEKIETELIEKVAKHLRLSGGQLDRILFQNYGDIVARLRWAKHGKDLR